MSRSTPTFSEEAIATLREAGRINARRRWGPPRRHNLKDLSPEQREIVNALIEAQRRANALKGGQA